MKILGLRDRVYYRGNYGMIDFVCEAYVVIALTTYPGKDYPRVLVFPENYCEVQQIRDHKND